MSKKTIITKHDKHLCAQKNTQFLDEHCPPNGDLGDLLYYDIELDSHVSNSLRQNLERKGYRYKFKNKYKY